MPEGSPSECVCLQISVPVGCLLGVVHWSQGPWRLKGQGLSGLSCSARKWGATLGNAETQRPESWAGSSPGGGRAGTATKCHIRLPGATCFPVLCGTHALMCVPCIYMGRRV